jgi:hypothetical protein
MPPSAIERHAALRERVATFWIAVICGTPTPATMRVVQIEPGRSDLDAVGAVVDERLRAVAGPTLPPITSTRDTFS